MREIIVIPATIDKSIFNNKNKLLRVASYSRVSTNFEEQLSSFHLQKSYYTDLILRTKGWVLAGTYADEGISGVTEEKRPDFLKLMRHCRKGKIDLIITKSISRFSRNIIITMNRIRELKALGIGIYFEKENLNTLEENSEFIITLLASIAQEESMSLSKNVRKGKQMAMQNGVVYWNYTQMYGYRKGSDGEPEIIPEHAKVITMIYNYYLRGKSDDGIAKTLNKSGVPTPSGGTVWKSASIKNILTYERYCGDVILQKTFVSDPISKKVKVNNGEFPKIHIKNNHTPIVSREIYEKAQEERTRRSSKRKISNLTMTEQGKYSSKYALSELLLCGDCLSHYRRAVWTKRISKEKQPVWRCIKRLDHGKEYCTHSVSVDEASLHTAIMEAINANQCSQNNIVHLVTSEVGLTLRKNTKDEFDIDEKRSELEQLTSAIMEIVASGNVYENMGLIKRMNEKAVKLQSLIEEYSQSLEACEISNSLEKMAHHLATAPTSNIEYDDVLVRQTINAIKVESQNKLRIYFKNGLEYEQEMETMVKSRNA